MRPTILYRSFFPKITPSFLEEDFNSKLGQILWNTEVVGCLSDICNDIHLVLCKPEADPMFEYIILKIYFISF